jgi:hypothetical protein
MAVAAPDKPRDGADEWLFSAFLRLPRSAKLRSRREPSYLLPARIGCLWGALELEQVVTAWCNFN